jgi:hypothetical protein
MELMMQRSFYGVWIIGYYVFLLLFIPIYGLLRGVFPMYWAAGTSNFFLFFFSLFKGNLGFGGIGKGNPPGLTLGHL